MKKISLALLVSSIIAPVASGVTTSLDLPGDGNYVSTTVLTSQTLNGATFDISYTVSAVSNDTNPVVGVISQLLGVGSDNDVNPQHYNTLEGDGSAGANGSTAGGEGLAFTDLLVTNFQANGSGLTIANIQSLKFEVLTVGSVNNNQDGISISFINYGDTTQNVNLDAGSTGATGATPFSIDLTALSNYSPTSDSLYIQPDNGRSTNRWNVSGISVSYVPEPSSSALLGLGFAGLLLRRRRA
ncbi:MAG: PEP-CTERM sorting domain-containing protein [Akkermansiaceae bacterium]